MRKCAKIAECRVFDHEIQGAFGINQQSGLKIDNKDMNIHNFQACSLTIFPKSSDFSWNRLFRVSSII